MNENRRDISAHFFRDLKEGALREIPVDCKRNSELLFIRDGYVNVYHQGRNLLKIGENERSQNYRLSFNFNYAKYQENRHDLLKRLYQLGFTLTGKGRNEKLVSYVPFDSAFSACEPTLAILRGLIDDYLRPCRGSDGNAQPPHRRPGGLEKQRQQEIALANRRLGEGYCIYDMEYAQKRGSRAEENLGRYDLLALRYQEGKPAALTFMELKSTKNACVGKSGIEKHEVDLQRYLQTETAKLRIGEAEQNIRRLSELGFIQGDAPAFLPETLPLETLFVFTDDARRYSGQARCSVEVGREDDWRVGQVEAK